MTFDPQAVLKLPIPEVTQEQAEADIRAMATEMGKTFAKTVMSATMMHELEPDDITDMVDRMLARMGEELRQLYATAGLDDKGDVEKFQIIVRGALVREGLYIARTSLWQAGQAASSTVTPDLTNTLTLMAFWSPNKSVCRPVGDIISDARSGQLAGVAEIEGGYGYCVTDEKLALAGMKKT